MFRVCYVYHLFDRGNCLHGWNLGIGNNGQLFLYTIFKTNPEMYEEVKNPAKTCKGLLETGLVVLGAMTGSHCVLGNGSCFGWLLDVPRVEGE